MATWRSANAGCAWSVRARKSGENPTNKCVSLSLTGDERWYRTDPAPSPPRLIPFFAHLSSFRTFPVVIFCSLRCTCFPTDRAFTRWCPSSGLFLNRGALKSPISPLTGTSSENRGRCPLTVDHWGKVRQGLRSSRALRNRNNVYL